RAACWPGRAPEGWLGAADWNLAPDDIPAVYARFLGPDDRPPVSGVDPDEARALRTEGDLSLMALVEDLACPVVNRIGGGLSNNSKPDQALVINPTRLLVPPPPVPSEPRARRAVIPQHRRGVYQTAGGGGSSG